MSAFHDKLIAAQPHAFDTYNYDLARIARIAAVAADDLRNTGQTAVDISPGDVTRYRFTLADVPAWRYRILAIVGGGCMDLPDPRMGIDGGYIRSKMPGCHPYTADFVAAFLTEMYAQAATTVMPEADQDGER